MPGTDVFSIALRNTVTSAISITNKPYKNFAHQKMGILSNPHFWLFISQLNLAGCVIGSTDQVAILIYLPGILGSIIIQIRGGSRSSERGGIGSYAISISGTWHMVNPDGGEAVRSSRTHSLTIAGIGIILLSVSPLHDIDLFQDLFSLRLFGFGGGSHKTRDSHCRQYPNDDHHDHQLDQGETF